MKQFLLLILFFSFSSAISAQMNVISYFVKNDLNSFEQWTLSTSDINASFDSDGVQFTAIGLSVLYDRPSFADVLISRKADLDIFCGDKTPLMYAASRGDLSFVKKLIEAGADVELKNVAGKSASDFAQQAGHAKIVDALTSISNK